jgi:hypothetical protein
MPRIGDVIEIPTPHGLAFAQYTHRHRLYGALLRILPGLYGIRPAHLSALVKGPQSYVAIFPALNDEVREGRFTIALHEDVPMPARPFPLFRAAGWREPRTGEVRKWWLWDGKREWSIDCLTTEQHALPLREMPTPGMLVQRLAKGWHPSDDLGQGIAVPGLTNPPPVTDRRLQHFFTFPSKVAAGRALTALIAGGYEAKAKPGRNRREWFVFAWQRTTAGNGSDMRDHFNELAAQHRGTYDGWELDIGP